MNSLEGIVAINKARGLDSSAKKTALPNGRTLFETEGILVVGQGDTVPLHSWERDLDITYLPNSRQYLVNHRLTGDRAGVEAQLLDFGVEDPSGLLETIGG